MITKSPIRKKILHLIEERILLAERKYEETCIEIDAEAQARKEKAFDSEVQSIIGKIL